MTCYRITSSIFLSLILIVSVVLNTTASYIMLFKVKKVELTHLFIVSLSITNLLESIIGLIPQIIISDESVLRKTPMCIVSGFAVFGFAVTSITHMSLFSLIRTVIVKYPFFYFQKCKAFYYKVALILSCYVYGFSWATFPFIGWSKYEIDLDKKRCSLDWKLSQPESRSFFLAVLIFCNILPGIVIALGLYYSTKIINRRKACKFRQDKKKRLVNILEIEYLKVNFLSAAIYFVIWTPYAVVSILTLLKITVPAYVVTVCALFSKLSTISNVLINCFINRYFQKHLLNLGLIKFLANSTFKRRLKNHPSTIFFKLERK
ncbi:opsin-3 isoform X1 [Hydra vulgaris]|uniref:opsin-3 isoform X1 n=1 Tax=Hydra vulgaris TaxID=6087 RepID=UPI001F5FA9A2|nr:opsin-3-like [Hydra vulgaris]